MKNQNENIKYSNILESIFDNLLNSIDTKNQKTFKSINKSFEIKKIDENKKEIILTTKNNLHKIILQNNFGFYFDKSIKDILKNKYEFFIIDEKEYLKKENEDTVSFMKRYEEINNQEKENKEKKKLYKNQIIQENLENNNINKNKNFDNYIPPKNNSMIYKAAYDVGNNPGKNWNPFFIFGNSGLGKTHLLHAIGNLILKNYSNFKIKYVPAKEFGEIIHNAIKSENTSSLIEEIKKTFNQFDVLLIDDIQFIKDWPKAKEIFFHIFNSFIEENKQVVLASDTYPQNLSKDSEGFEQRFITRFEKGLTIGINPPDIESAKQIVKFKLNNDLRFNIKDIEEESIDYIAQNFSASINELEGAINKIIFYSINNDQNDEKNKITMKLINEAFKNNHSKKNTITLDEIVENVVKYYNISKSELFSKNRKKIVMNSRKIAIYLSRELLNWSLIDIGKKFERNHSTIINSINKIEKERKNNEELNEAISKIRGLILK